MALTPAVHNVIVQPLWGVQSMETHALASEEVGDDQHDGQEDSDGHEQAHVHGDITSVTEVSGVHCREKGTLFKTDGKKGRKGSRGFDIAESAFCSCVCLVISSLSTISAPYFACTRMNTGTSLESSPATGCEVFTHKLLSSGVPMLPIFSSTQEAQHELAGRTNIKNSFDGIRVTQDGLFPNSLAAGLLLTDAEGEQAFSRLR